MKFFVGLHQPSDARHFGRSFVSVSRLRSRRSDFSVGDWIMDSGAFSEIATHGRYRASVEEYVEQVHRWARCGRMLAAVSQDYMCEPWIVAKTGLSVLEHQRLTIERYDAMRAAVRFDIHVMPVLQGYTIDDYVLHLRAYGSRLTPGTWVGVGSVCKRNANVREIESILLAIRTLRPDLRLHGFGLKMTALASQTVRDCLHSADSMAWSFNARKNGRSANDWREAARFADWIERMPTQRSLFGEVAA